MTRMTRTHDHGDAELTAEAAHVDFTGLAEGNAPGIRLAQPTAVDLAMDGSGDLCLRCDADAGEREQAPVCGGAEDGQHEVPLSTLGWLRGAAIALDPETGEATVTLRTDLGDLALTVFEAAEGGKVSARVGITDEGGRTRVLNTGVLGWITGVR